MSATGQVGTSDAARPLWPPIALGAAVVALCLTSLWWSVRGSLDTLIDPPALRVCPAIYPAPAECTPEWHVVVAAVGATAVLLAYAVVVVLSLRTRRPAVAYLALAALVVVAAGAALIAHDPVAFLRPPELGWDGGVLLLRDGGAVS